MKVLLTSAYRKPMPDYGARWLLRNAREGLDHVVADPERADAIVFVEQPQWDDPFFRSVRASTLFTHYPEKCLLYHSSDSCVPFCRSMTPSNDRRLAGKRTRRTFHYIARLYENEHVNAALPRSWSPKFLYSFQGADVTHVVRRELFSGKHPEGMMVNHGGVSHHGVPEGGRAHYERQYVELIGDSQFVLCPRGFGPCSYRLFETMQLGRVPVIISDDWVPVPGVPWSECSLTVKEKEIGVIPDLLNRRRGDAQEMGRVARQVWERHFSPAVSLQRMIEAAGELLAHPFGLTENIVECRNLMREPFGKIFLAGVKNRIWNRCAWLRWRRHRENDSIV